MTSIWISLLLLNVLFHVFISYMDIFFCPCKLGLVASAFKPSTHEAEGKDNLVSSKFDHGILGQPGMHNETLSARRKEEEEDEEMSISLLI